MSWITRLVPSALTTRLARHAVPLAIGAVAAILLLLIVATALVSPGALGIAAARVSQTTSLDTVVAGGLTERDADNDGLSDALENYVYGTDPENWDSAGIGIPDGWLVQFGYDPLDPATREARGRAPPSSKLPAAYADGYPLAYTPPLSVYYEYARPPDYRPGVDAPWWRRGEHADPIAADQTGTGLPTGWLLARDVPLKDVLPDRVASGSRGNLTLREAFEHDTDPYKADSDDDGLDDWIEIHVTNTDPSKFSTPGIGIADGWLVHYKLPLDPQVATQDPDRDGLTNLEEFRASRAHVGEAAGITALFTRGLNPLDWQTAQTGIPDGWYERYGLSPFGTDVDRLIGKASDFPEYRTYVPEGEAPLPDISFTVRGAYEYARPDDWNESTKGVWWGGTNPITLDSDNDGLPDPVEIRGWYANVTFDTGPEAKPRVYRATSNPLEADSDGDGLSDLEEYRGRTNCGTTTERSFPPTDPRNRDTAFSLISDHEKVCGVVRGEARYDLAAKGATPGLDPTRADSAGDLVKDGTRVDFWHARADALRANPRYPYNASAYKTVFEWTEKYARFSSLTKDQTIAQFRPDGDADGDGILNAADADPSGGLHAEKFGSPDDPRTKVYFLGGPQIDPAAYRLTEFASPVPHSATDPANPDTDGDGLPDSWETRFGRFDAATGGWDLDPAKTDSDGDGVPDGKANNDKDVIVWYSFDRRGAAIERTSRSFSFTNELEFVAGTDPNTVSTAGDGVSDGWKAFWGSRVASDTYPNLVGVRDATLGSVALDAIADIEAALAASPITPTADLRGLGAKTTGYVRLVEVSSCSTDLVALTQTGERVAPDNACYDGNNLDNRPIKIARIQGAKAFTYADEARLRTNPYAYDTDGDGAPDAYEAYFRVVTPGGTAYPDPVVDDRTRDPDGDGLNVADECASVDGRRCAFETFTLADAELGAGADPNNGDTDSDGIQDGIESGALINPLDPSDVESFARADKDGDEDGVPDFQELTGKDSTTYFDQRVRTNPKDPDSDGDGLLDGETITLPRTSPLVANWSARGIAHRVLPNGSVDFLGERTFGKPFGMRPDKLDSAVPDVPDGWLAYYNQNPKERTVEKAPYEARRPTWWSEAVHGVWWWGDAPGVSVPDDADGDGLHDASGEDPFPATNRLNRIVDGTLRITDPADVKEWVEAAPTPEAERLRAQKLGDGAGDPATARASALAVVDPATDVYVRNMRACVAITDFAAPATVHKGVAFNATGRVVLNERASGVCGTGGGALLEPAKGLANRTVLLSVFSPAGDRIVGAGFTNATGHFNLSANITQNQVYEIPRANLTLLGSVGPGFASARFDPTLLATGTATGTEQNRLVAWVYNTSTTASPGEPTHAGHLARVADRAGVVKTVTVNATKFAASAPLPVTVRATTDIDIDVSDTATNGERLAGEIRLVDASGAPLLDKTVVVRWAGSTSPVELRNLTTDRNGRINLTRVGIPIGVTQADQYALVANFTSTDPDLLPTQSTHFVRVRDPSELTVTADVPSATVGETVSVSGVVSTRPVVLPDGRTRPGGGVDGAAVTLTLGGSAETASADAEGRFTVRIVVPGTLSAGEQALQVSFGGSEAAGPSETSLPLAVKRTASVLDLNRLEGPRGIEVTLRGRLVDNEGQGFDGRIEVHNDKAGMLARGSAALDGSFRIAVPLGALELGPQQLRVVFPGDGAHAAAQNLTQARVTSTTRLVLAEAPSVVVRGGTFAIRAELLDDEGAPVVAQPVAGYWRGERTEVIVTDATGAVTFLVPTNLSERPGPTSLGADFTPPPTSVYQPSAASASVRVVQGVTLDLPDASVARGPLALAGRLVDDENRPLPGAAIQISFDGASIGEARSSRNGSFELVHVVPDDVALGAHRVRARFIGTATLANATTDATWHIRSPVQVDLTTLGPLVRGENAPLEARVTDDRGAPVDASLRFFLAGRDLGVLRSSSGKLLTTLPIPDDIPRGPTTLRITSVQTDAYDALAQDIPVIVKIRPTVEVELPTLAVRGFAIGGGVTLLDDKGEPLRNTTYAYVIGTGKSAVVGTTNTDGRGAIAGVAPTAGDGAVSLTVRGGTDVLPAQYRTTSMKVVGPATPIGYAALVVAALVVLAIAGLVIAAVLLRRRQLQEAREILDEAIRDLLAGNEYAGTIFLAYRRFAAYLARHGFAEKASDTPREFALGVRKALPIGAVPLRALIGLFEEARYSDHAIGSYERDRAVESLTTVRAELDRVLGSRKVSA